MSGRFSMLVVGVAKQPLNSFLQKSPFPKDNHRPGDMKILGYRGAL
jgi:hypothetical protein